MRRILTAAHGRLDPRRPGSAPVRRVAPAALAGSALAGLALVLLAGCGLKGDLFLPADPPAAADPGAPDASDDASDDGRDDDLGDGSEDRARDARDSTAVR